MANSQEYGWLVDDLKASKREEGRRKREDVEVEVGVELYSESYRRRAKSRRERRERKKEEEEEGGTGEREGYSRFPKLVEAKVDHKLEGRAGRKRKPKRSFKDIRNELNASMQGGGKMTVRESKEGRERKEKIKALYTTAAPEPPRTTSETNTGGEERGAEAAQTQPEVTASTGEAQEEQKGSKSARSTQSGDETGRRGKEKQRSNGRRVGEGSGVAKEANESKQMVMKASESREDTGEEEFMTPIERMRAPAPLEPIEWQTEVDDDEVLEREERNDGGREHKGGKLGTWMRQMEQKEAASKGGETEDDEIDGREREDGENEEDGREQDEDERGLADDREDGTDEEAHGGVSEEEEREDAGDNEVIRRRTPTPSPSPPSTPSPEVKTPEPTEFELPRPYALKMEVAETPAELLSVELAIVQEVNLARTNPRGYAKMLEAELEAHVDHLGVWRRHKHHPGVQLREGPAVFKEAAVWLREQKPVRALEYSRGLSLAARDHCADLGSTGRTGHGSTHGGGPSERCQKYGEFGSGWSGCTENLAYGLWQPRDIVMYLLVDDGVETRGHRTNLMRKEDTLMGVGLGQHQAYDWVCTMVTATRFREIPVVRNSNDNVNVLAVELAEMGEASHALNVTDIELDTDLVYPVSHVSQPVICEEPLLRMRFANPQGKSLSAQLYHDDDVSDRKRVLVHHVPAHMDRRALVELVLYFDRRGKHTLVLFADYENIGSISIEAHRVISTEVLFPNMYYHFAGYVYAPVTPNILVGDVVDFKLEVPGAKCVKVGGTYLDRVNKGTVQGVETFTFAGKVRIRAQEITVWKSDKLEAEEMERNYGSGMLQGVMQFFAHHRSGLEYEISGTIRGQQGTSGADGGQGGRRGRSSSSSGGGNVRNESNKGKSKAAAAGSGVLGSVLDVLRAQEDGNKEEEEEDILAGVKALELNAGRQRKLAAVKRREEAEAEREAKGRSGFAGTLAHAQALLERRFDESHSPQAGVSFMHVPGFVIRSPRKGEEAERALHSPELEEMARDYELKKLRQGSKRKKEKQMAERMRFIGNVDSSSLSGTGAGGGGEKVSGAGQMSEEELMEEVRRKSEMMQRKRAEKRERQLAARKAKREAETKERQRAMERHELTRRRFQRALGAVTSKNKEEARVRGNTLGRTMSSGLRPTGELSPRAVNSFSQAAQLQRVKMTSHLRTMSGGVRSARGLGGGHG